jgi:hypothetical protein
MPKLLHLAVELKEFKLHETLASQAIKPIQQGHLNPL